MGAYIPGMTIAWHCTFLYRSYYSDLLKCGTLAHILDNTVLYSRITDGLTKRGKDVPELGGVDEAIAVLVKDTQTLDEVLHRTRVLLLLTGQKDGKKLLKTHTLVAWNWYAANRQTRTPTQVNIQTNIHTCTYVRRVHHDRSQNNKEKERME